MAASVVIAPDSFKGTAPASTVARAIAEGWSRARPDDAATLIPLADGGEGTIDALHAANPGSSLNPVTVSGPDGTPIETHWLRIPAPAGDIGVVEMALTSGLTLPRPASAMDSDSRGFGDAIVAALDAGVHSLLLALGGSATSDGGQGALRALGLRISDDEGSDIGAGNSGLADARSVDVTALRHLPPGGATILADVRSPLLGEFGAVAVFGPQKGISDEQAQEAERNLERFADLVEPTLGVAPSSSGAGAAGGMGYAMLAWGARAESGGETVVREAGFLSALATASVVVTGEGRYDSQSEQGKLVSIVREHATRRGVPVLLVAGSIGDDPTGFRDAASLTDAAGDVDAAIADPARWTAAAAESLAARFED